MNIKHRFRFLTLALMVSAVSSCSRAPVPDVHPSESSVKLNIWGNQFQLGPKSSKLFIEMLSQKPVRSNISEMPAEPLGTFTVSGVDYLWHGNAVIRGQGSEERLWHGAYLQSLIKATMPIDISDAKAVQSVLNKLENDPSISKVAVEGPGAYPGGGDALHPVSADDPEGWKVFTPNQTTNSKQTGQQSGSVPGSTDQ